MVAGKYLLTTLSHAPMTLSSSGLRFETEGPLTSAFNVTSCDGVLFNKESELRVSKIRVRFPGAPGLRVGIHGGVVSNSACMTFNFSPAVGSFSTSSSGSSTISVQEPWSWEPLDFVLPANWSEYGSPLIPINDTLKIWNGYITYDAYNMQDAFKGQDFDYAVDLEVICAGMYTSTGVLV